MGHERMQTTQLHMLVSEQRCSSDTAKTQETHIYIYIYIYTHIVVPGMLCCCPWPCESSRDEPEAIAQPAAALAGRRVGVY